MVNNTFFKLKPQTNKLSSKVPSSAGAVSHTSMDMNMTVKKPDYATAINKLNSNVLSRMLTSSRNYKLGIGISTLKIQATVATVETVQATVNTVQNTVSVSGSADGVGNFDLLPWDVLY